MIIKSTLLCCAFFSQICIGSAGATPNPAQNENQQFGTGLVTTEWLSSNIAQEDLIIVDVRSAAEFESGRIPNSINIPFGVPFSVWTTMKGELLVESPSVAELADSLGAYGITEESKVILVTSLPTADNPFSLAAPTRVALTLAYAGFTEVAILDGGIDKWVGEGRIITTENTIITPSIFTAKEDKKVFVEKEYVNKNLEKLPIVDARDAVVYAGDVIEPWANKAGHIPNALSLPAPALWNIDGTYKTKDEIKTIVKEVVGDDTVSEIIIYCGVGGYASTVWYALTKILDYKNVKVYDGSSQEWVLFYDMVTTPVE